MNPNIEVPVPKTIQVKKVAVDLVEYDEARELARVKGENIMNLSQPADPVNLQMDHGENLPAYMYHQNGYRRTPMNKTGPRKRNREYKINEFVDSSRAIIGSSQEDSERQGSIKVVNSDEEKNIIQKKPVVRAPERRLAKRELDKTDPDGIISSDDMIKEKIEADSGEDGVKRRLKEKRTKRKKEKIAE